MMLWTRRHGLLSLSLWLGALSSWSVGANDNTTDEHAVAVTCAPCTTTDDCRQSPSSPTVGTADGGGLCVNNQCAVSDRDGNQTTTWLPLLQVGCVCRNGEDCQTGRCEGGVFQGTCALTLPTGAGCNEDSDCTSGDCRAFFCRSSLDTTTDDDEDDASAAIPTTSPTRPETAPSSSGTELQQDDDGGDSIWLLIGLVVGVGLGAIAAVMCYNHQHDNGRRCCPECHSCPALECGDCHCDCDMEALCCCCCRILSSTNG